MEGSPPLSNLPLTTLASGEERDEDTPLEELNRSSKLGRDFLDPFWREMEKSARMGNTLAPSNLYQTLSVEVGRVLAQKQRLEKAQERLYSHNHFLKEEKEKLMQKLTVTKDEMDELRKDVDEKLVSQTKAFKQELDANLASQATSFQQELNTRLASQAAEFERQMKDQASFFENRFNTLAEAFGLLKGKADHGEGIAESYAADARRAAEKGNH